MSELEKFALGIAKRYYGDKRPVPPVPNMETIIWSIQSCMKEEQLTISKQELDDLAKVCHAKFIEYRKVVLRKRVREMQKRRN